MIKTIAFLLLFFSCLCAMILYPKTEGKLNICKMIVMGTMTIFCYQAFMALIYKITGVTVGLTSTLYSMVPANIVLWVGIGVKRRIQKVFIRWTDVLCLAVLIAFIAYLSLHMFTADLRLSYVNTDPANHFRFAMNIVEYGELDSIYFSAFVDAMFIQLAAPFIPAASYYKAFIISNIFMHMLEICMFYVLVLTVSEKKIVRIFAPFFSVFYFFGFPAYSYMTGGFVYWSNGVMILMLIIYALLLIERYPKMLRYTGVVLFFGAYANSCCNRLFIPVNFLALFVILFIMIFRHRKAVINKKAFAAIIAGTICAGVVAALFFFRFWSGSIEKMLRYVSNNGGMYRSMYADLVFFIPALVLVFYYVFYKREKGYIIPVMTLCMFVCTVAMYVLWYNYLMSTYYYYKIYYNLWLMAWLLVAMALAFMAEKKQLIGFFSYGSMIVLIGYLVLTDYDGMMWERRADYNGPYATQQMFSLYRYNMDSLLTDYEEYQISDGILDVYAYAVENTHGEYVPILTMRGECLFWYDGMKAQSSLKLAGDKRTLMWNVRKLDKLGVDKIVIIKEEDEYYTKYQDYFDKCEVIYENAFAAVLTYPGDSWSDVAAMNEDYSESKLELYDYVAENLADETVPLMTEEDHYYDLIYYYNVTGQKAEDYYVWEYNPRESLENLNEHGTQYVLLLYDSEYYQTNAQYFDSQETVYETEAGKIVRCVGEKWSLTYK